MNFLKGLKETDPEIFDVCINELNRGRKGLELIASENYVSKAVLQALGSVLTNKYSEGYPKRRYYGGNEFIDISESLAINRAKELFGAERANVQPHSGSQANMAAYHALIELGDPILTMSLAHGGHLTHGHHVNFSGQFYKIFPYGVSKESHRIDMDDVRKLALENKPKLILAGFSAYPRDLDFKAFREIADEVGAYLMADIAHVAGLVSVNLSPDPIPYCDVVTTTTHKTLRGPRGGLILSTKKHVKKINRAVFPGMQGGPLEHVIAAKAVCFKEALQPEFKDYQEQILKNAKALAESLMEHGAKLFTDGTDNHLMLLDLHFLKEPLWGKEAEKSLDEVGIFTNKNAIPFDDRSPFDPSGLRMGTPALTTRGLKESGMKAIGELIVKTLNNARDKTKLEKIREEVIAICDEHPLYEGFEILR